MSKTFDEILESMKTEFFNECGEYAENYPETALRFKAVASEIYAAYTAADYALRQVFVQTASGEYLDRHGRMRSITRKKASFAKGALTFSLPQELETDVDIPKGTVCSVKGSPLVQFATDENAVIPAGSLSVSVPATALSSGGRFNAAVGCVTVMVNPPEYVVSVTNNEPFYGGSDDETDEALRSRIIESYSSVSNGISTKSFEEQILLIDGVKDVSIVFNTDLNAVVVWVRTESGDFPGSEITAPLSEKLSLFNICSVRYAVYSAHKSEFSVYAAVKAARGADKEQLLSDVESRIREICSVQKIGQQLPVSLIATTVCNVENVQGADVSADPSYEGIIACSADEYLVLKDVQVEIYE